MMVRSRIALGLFAFAALAQSASAEPIVVTGMTGGQVSTVAGREDALFSVWRQNFGLTDVFVVMDTPSLGGLQVCATGCTAGEELSVQLAGPLRGSAGAILGSSETPDAHFENTRVSGNVSFFSAAFTIADDAPDLYNLFVPLEVRARLMLFGEGQREPLLIITPIHGRGTAWLQFHAMESSAGGERRFRFNGLNYVFSTGEGHPAATPEPASVLLLGTGAAFVMAARRRRHGVPCCTMSDSRRA